MDLKKKTRDPTITGSWGTFGLTHGCIDVLMSHKKKTKFDTSGFFTLPLGQISVIFQISVILDGRFLKASSSRNSPEI